MKISETIEYKMLKSRLQYKDQLNKNIALEIESLLTLIANVELRQTNKEDIEKQSILEMCQNHVKRIDRLCDSGINTDCDIRNELCL